MAEHPFHGRAAFDWQGFARDCRAAFSRRNLGYRALAELVGVTISDLSRAAGGTNISVEKVMAICDFIGVPERRYFRPPPRENIEKSGCFTGTNVKRQTATGGKADRPAEPLRGPARSVGARAGK